MRSEIFKVVKTQSAKEIIEQEDLATIGGTIVEACNLCSIDLKGSVYVSMLAPISIFEKIKDDTEFIVEENGWWNTLADDTVVVKRLNGEIIKPIKIW